MSRIQSLSADILTDLRRARCEAGVRAALARAAAAAGCVRFQMAPGPHNPATDPDALLACGDFDPAWSARYRFARPCRDDPAWNHAVQRAGPVRWRRVFLDARAPGERAHIAAAREHGLRDGVTCAVHGPQGCVALVMFAAGRMLDLGPEDEEALALIAIAAHQRVKRIAAAALFQTPEPPPLTQRERECLAWVLEGKTNWEIGVLMGVSARTVQFHLSNAGRKLDAANRIKAAVRALMAGLVAPPEAAARAPARSEAPGLPIPLAPRRRFAPSPAGLPPAANGAGTEMAG